MGTAAISFKRTLRGRRNKPLFVPYVLVYVEGDDDVAFFTPIAERLGCKFEGAGGKGEAVKLAEAACTGSAGYLVIMDADFDRFAGRALECSQVHYLDVYSIENLLARDEVLAAFIACYCAAHAEEVGNPLGDFLSSAQGVLRRVVVADLAASLSQAGDVGVPARIDIWLNDGVGLPRLKTAVSNEIHRIEDRLSQDALLVAADKLNSLSDGEVVRSFLRGHLVFGIIRRVVFYIIRNVFGGKCSADNRMLLVGLSQSYWAHSVGLNSPLFRRLSSSVSSLKRDGSGGAGPME